jgi:carbonic anhydrase
MGMKTAIFLITLAFSLAAAFDLESQTTQNINADTALQKLMDGNRSYVSNRLTIDQSSGPVTRKALASGQQPYAVILSCSDSRVPPEIIFDKGLGEIFVVRDAGNIPDPIVVGSIEYAVENLGSSLIMVLGHSRCGAVKAAVEATDHEHGNLGAIIKTIAPAVRLARKDAKGANKSELLEAAIDLNIKLTAQSLVKQSPIIRSLVDSGKVKIVKAKYDLDDGTVKLLEN